MGPIEIMWVVLIIIFGIIGLVRGFLKELGVTTVLLVILFALDRWGSTVAGYALRGLGYAGLSLASEPAKNVAQAAVYVIVILIGSFVSYHGETLTFQGTQLKGMFGALMGLAIGLVNGYLIVGAIWYYINEFDYPLGLVSQPLSPVAQQLVQVLPLNLLPALLPFLVVFMVIVRVIR